MTTPTTIPHGVVPNRPSIQYPTRARPAVAPANSSPIPEWRTQPEKRRSADMVPSARPHDPVPRRCRIRIVGRHEYNAPCEIVHQVLKCNHEGAKTRRIRGSVGQFYSEVVQ